LLPWLQGKTRCTVAEGELFDVSSESDFTVDSSVVLEVRGSGG